MVLLPGLPEEMLEEIMKYLLPDDIDNFIASFEEFRIIANRLRPKHEHRKQEYTEVFCGLFDEDAHHPLFLLRDICKDSEIVWYVKDMYIELCEDHFEDENEEVWEEARKVAVEYKDGITKMIEACPYLNGEERKRWTSETLSGHQMTAVALFASMFPCLEYISIVDTFQDAELCLLVRKIKEARSLNPGGSHALDKLKYVDAGASLDEVYALIDPFDVFSAMPSMSRYTGQQLYQSEERWRDPGDKSTISTLELNKSMIHINVLQRVFSTMTNLQRFTYEYYWAWEAEGRDDMWERDWQPGKIIISLLEFAGHSLVDLDLTRNGSREEELLERTRDHPCHPPRMWFGRDDDRDRDYICPGPVEPFLGSLRGFQVLKNIRVQNEGFVEEDPKDPANGRRVHRLVDLLPASVERVELALPQLCIEESCRLIEGLPELKAERVPNLTTVITESGTKVKIVHTAAGIQFIQ